MKQIVGILLDRDTFSGIPKGKTGTERIHLYNRAADQLGLQPYFMSLSKIGRKSALGYSFTGNSYKLVRIFARKAFACHESISCVIYQADKQQRR